MLLKKVKQKLLYLSITVAFLLPTFPTQAATVNKYNTTTTSLQATENNSIVVHNYDELSNALSQDNGYTYIYISGDIIQTARTGITINTNKTSVVIDGLAPEATSTASFTQFGSSNFSHTINVTNTNIQQVEVKNLNINGDNYYGFIGVSNSCRGVSVIYDNITYSGPQIAYNIYGTTKFKDVDITIQDGSKNNAQEVAESDHIILEGNVIINSHPYNFGVFHMRSSSCSLTVIEDANVVINTTNYLINAPNKIHPVVTIGKNSSFTYTGTWYGFQWQNQSISSLTIESGATVDVTQNKQDYTYGFFRIESYLEMQEGSSLYLNKGTGGYAFQFTKAGAQANFNNPKRVKLYVQSGNMFYYNGAGNLNITTDAINCWNSTDYQNDSMDKSPTYMWNKKVGEKLSIHSEINRTNQTINSHNFEIGKDPTKTEFTNETFNLKNNQMLVFGQFDLTVDTITNTSKAISGTTQENADINISYGNNQITTKAVDTNYTVNVNDELNVDEVVTVLSHYNHLKKVVTTKVVDGGRLSLITVPTISSFGTQTIPSTSVLYETSDKIKIEIEDSRFGDTSWGLYVSLSEAISATVDSEKQTLPADLIYINSIQQEFEITQEAIELISGSGNMIINGSKGEGIYLRVYPGEIYSNVEYGTTIHWVLQSTP